MKYPQIIQNLINNFSSLPGIGQKTAERLVFYLLKNGNGSDLELFGKNLMEIKKQIKVCANCGNLSENGACLICNDAKRNKTIICVVAEAQDIFYLDKTGSFNGLYHVLGGLLSPASGMTADKLNLKSLVERLGKNGAQEVILGINPTVEGETTMLYIKKLINEKFPAIKITRLSRGLPMGGDLEYADEVTLSSAIRGRSEV